MSIGISGKDSETSSEDVEATYSPMETSSLDDKIFASATDAISSSTLVLIPNLEPSTHEEISRSSEEATVTGDSTDVEPSGSRNPESLITTLAASITTVAPNSETVDTFNTHVETSSSIGEGTVTDRSTHIEPLHDGDSKLFTATVATSSTNNASNLGTEAFSTHVETFGSIEEITVTDGSTDSPISDTISSTSEAFVEVTSSTDIQTASSVSTELETSTTPITPIVDVVEEIIDTLEKHPVSHY